MAGSFGVVRYRGGRGERTVEATGREAAASGSRASRWRSYPTRPMGHPNVDSLVPFPHCPLPVCVHVLGPRLLLQLRPRPPPAGRGVQHGRSTREDGGLHQVRGKGGQRGGARMEGVWVVQRCGRDARRAKTCGDVSRTGWVITGAMLRRHSVQGPPQGVPRLCAQTPGPQPLGARRWCCP